MLKATAVRSPLPVMLLILPCPPCLLHGGVQQGEGGPVGGGGWGRGGVRGRGTFHSPCHILLHYHMMLRPKGTSHNQPERLGRPFRNGLWTQVTPHGSGSVLQGSQVTTPSAPCSTLDQTHASNFHKGDVQHSLNFLCVRCYSCQVITTDHLEPMTNDQMKSASLIRSLETKGEDRTNLLNLSIGYDFKASFER